MKTKINYRNLIDYFIWIPVVIIPLITSKKVLDSSLLPKYTALIIFLIFFIIYFLKNKNEKYLHFPKPIFTVLLVYLGYSFITILYSPLIFDAVFEWSKIFLFVILITYLINYYDFDVLKTEIPKAITILGLIISIFGIIGFFHLCKTSVNHNALYTISTFFSHKNLYTEILFLSMPFGIYIMQTNKQAWKITGCITFIFCFGLIIILMTRAVWLATILSSIITLIAYLIIKKPTKKSLLKISFLSIAAFIFIGISVFVYSHFDTPATFKKQGEKIFNTHYGSAFDRIELWNKSINIIKEKPVFGSGLASWKINILKQGNENLKSSDQITFYQRPHNDYIWITSEMGILGLIIYLVFIFLVYKLIFKKIKENRNSNNLYLYILLAFTGYLVYSFFSFPKERIDHIILLSVFMALIIKNGNHNKKINSLNFSLFTILALVILLIVSILRIKSENCLKKVYLQKNKGNWHHVIQSVNKIPDLYVIDPVSTPVTWYKGTAYFMLNDIENALKSFNEAYKVNPYHIHVLNNLGSCFALTNNKIEAFRLYSEALQIAPNFEEALINKCIIAAKLNAFDEAYKTFNKINPANKDEKYKALSEVFITEKFLQIQNNINDEYLNPVIKAMFNNKTWISDIYKKSYYNNISFEIQTIQDAIFVLEKLDKSVSGEKANELRKKYNISSSSK